MKLERPIEIKNRLGLHARASAKLVKAAAQFECDVRLQLDGQSVDAKSIMGLMMLAAAQGTHLTLGTDGVDAKAAMTLLQQLIEERFEEDE